MKKAYQKLQASSTMPKIAKKNLTKQCKLAIINQYLTIQIKMSLISRAAGPRTSFLQILKLTKQIQKKLILNFC